MKIVFFDFATLNYGGGCEKNFMAFGNWMDKKGNKVSFITGSKELNQLWCSLVGLGKHKCNISNLDILNKFMVKEYLTFNLIDLILPTKNKKLVVNKLKFADKIISKNEIFEILILTYLFKINPNKIVFGVHTPLFYPSTKTIMSKIHNCVYSSKFYFNLLKNSFTRVLSLNSVDYTLLKKNGLNQVIIIPNPIDTKKFCLKKYLKKEKYKIYFIGRMTEQKGIDQIYGTVISLSKSKNFSKMQFIFVGCGPEEKYLLELSEKFNNCIFKGFQTDIVQFYHDADIVIVPSRWEGMPYSILEAQSCGVPVIATNIPGNNDIIINKKNRFFV